MLTQRLWTHERTIEPRPGGGATLTDRVTFLPKLPALAGAQLPVYRLVFTYRHYRLKRLFGVSGA